MSALSEPSPITIPISSPSPNSAPGPAWRSARLSPPTAGRISLPAVPPASITAFASSRELPCAATAPAPPENAVRWLDVDLPEQGFGFTVIHILTANPGAKEPEGAAKTRFWDALLAAAEARIAEPLLFLGDFNTGLPLVDEAGSTFVCAAHLSRPPAPGRIG